MFGPRHGCMRGLSYAHFPRSPPHRPNRQTGWVWPQMFGLFDSKDVTTTDPIKAIAEVDATAWAQMLVLVGSFEALEYKWRKSGTDKPFFDPFNQVPKDPKKAALKAESELKNGGWLITCINPTFSLPVAVAVVAAE